MKFLYKDQEYPLILEIGNLDRDQVFRTIAPDLNGEYWLLEFNSSNGVKIIDALEKDYVIVVN